MENTVLTLLRTLALSVYVIALIASSAIASDHKTALEMKNTAEPLTNLMTGGQPSIKDLQTLAANGTKVIVNLRTAGEFKQFDEKKVVEDLGMKYVSIEVAGSDGINIENAQILDNVLKDMSQPVLVHCASSNRVGGLLAYRAFKLQGQSAEDSLKLGKAAGMRSTEKKVLSLIKAN